METLLLFSTDTAMTTEHGSALYFETVSRLVCVAGCLDDGGGAASTGAFMIFITAKFRVLPEYADDWAAIAGPFTPRVPQRAWLPVVRLVSQP